MIVARPCRIGRGLANGAAGRAPGCVAGCGPILSRNRLKEFRLKRIVSV